jgi:hypothetical protein
MRDLRDMPGAAETIAEAELREVARRRGCAGSISVSHWRPRSNRKHRVRHFATLAVDGRPEFVAKIRTDPEDPKVAAEGRILQALAASGSAPVPLRQVGEEGFVMPYVPDEDLPVMFRHAGAERRRALVGATVDAVARFHLGNAPLPTPLSEPSLSAFLGDWRPGTARERQALAEAPCGAMHGDLGPWNIRISKTGELRMIDWEDFRPAGVPILDLINALVTLTLLVHPDYGTMDGPTLYRKTLVEPGEMPALLRDGLHAYCAQTGASAETCLALIPTYCRAMLCRFEAEGRPTSHLFYVPLLEYFRLQDVLWVAR